MPRQCRIQANTGIYHVMIRGINKMDIFLDNLDRVKFLETLHRMKTEGEYVLYGYCLMNNHVHLLIKEEIDSLSRTMKRIGISYSSYFNKRYKRVGHLFQDRFRSERIETENSILTCLRYIHNNPIKAHITKNLSDYKWSSYSIYTGKYEDDIIDTSFILDTFSENKSVAIEKFKIFSDLNSYEEFIELQEKEELIIDPLQIIRNTINKYNIELEDLIEYKDKKTRNKIILEMKENTKLSSRELSNITKLSKDMIIRATK